jgi:hypothetical protein
VSWSQILPCAITVFLFFSKMVFSRCSESMVWCVGKDFALEQSFRTTHAMLVLYMWLSLCRLRSEGKDGGAIGQSLYDAFNHDLERRIIATGVSIPSPVLPAQLDASQEFYGISWITMFNWRDAYRFCS